MKFLIKFITAIIALNSCIYCISYPDTPTTIRIKDKCMTDEGMSDASMRPCTGAANQMWRFRLIPENQVVGGWYRLISSTGRTSQKNGNQLLMSGGESNWIEYRTRYSIVNLASDNMGEKYVIKTWEGTCFDITRYSTAWGDEPCNNTENQTVYIKELHDVVYANSEMGKKAAAEKAAADKAAAEKKAAEQAAAAKAAAEKQAAADKVAAEKQAAADKIKYGSRLGSCKPNGLKALIKNKKK